MVMKPRAAVFLDRDGVLVRPAVREGKPFAIHSLAEFELLPGVAKACEILRRIGPLVVVTNQPDVARGTAKRDEIEKIHTELQRRLPIDRIEACYENGRDPNSLFYKPATGMLRRAAQEMNLDLAASIMIGDRWRDVACGHAAGCLTVWIDRGYAEPSPENPDHIVPDLPAAAELLARLGKIPAAYA